eukprot:TRINITY_DN10534_c0_g1_i2.p1 TRINITY_DN10534_c0_g1~~TRINITY_DN10534_c0_g1_i2.p1  ORF type:complete len:428 (-),score=80.98 TRINITY_DN10534_c0_g1_i2:173-1456(-)
MLGAMRIHPMTIQLQLEALEVIEKLLQWSATSPCEHGAVLAGNDNHSINELVVVSVSELMAVNLDSSQFQTRSCRVLGLICGSGAVITAQVATNLVNAMLHHSVDRELHVAGAQLVALLGPGRLKSKVWSNFVLCLRPALHSDDILIKTTAVEAIGQLGHAGHAETGECIDPLLDVMAGDNEIAHHAYLAILAILQCVLHTLPTCFVDRIEHILDLSWSTQSFERSVDSLALLTKAKDLQLSATALKTVLGLMEKTEDCRLQQLGCAVLAQAAESEQTAAAIIEQGGGNIVLSAMARCTDKTQIMQSGSWVLKLLIQTKSATGGTEDENWWLHAGAPAVFLCILRDATDPELCRPVIESVLQLLQVHPQAHGALAIGSSELVSCCIRLTKQHTASASCVLLLLRALVQIAPLCTLDDAPQFLSLIHI